MADYLIDPAAPMLHRAELDTRTYEQVALCGAARGPEWRLTGTGVAAWREHRKIALCDRCREIVDDIRSTAEQRSRARMMTR